MGGGAARGPTAQGRCRSRGFGGGPAPAPAEAAAAVRARSPCTWRRPRGSASPGQPASPPRLCHGEPAARPSAPGRRAVPQRLGPGATGPGRGAAARQGGAELPGRGGLCACVCMRAGWAGGAVCVCACVCVRSSAVWGHFHGRAALGVAAAVCALHIRVRSAVRAERPRVVHINMRGGGSMRMRRWIYNHNRAAVRMRWAWGRPRCRVEEAGERRSASVRGCGARGAACSRWRGAESGLPGSGTVPASALASGSTSATAARSLRSGGCVRERLPGFHAWGDAVFQGRRLV